jgi:hypothetical protein
MTVTRHGLSIGIERVDQSFFLFLKARGKLTHQDYQVITPMIDAALKEVESPKIKAIVDITEMQGWELRAAWDDFELGVKHGSEFEKIALYGNQHWQEIAANIGSWFVSGEIKYFEEYQQALDWLNE